MPSPLRTGLPVAALLAAAALSPASLAGESKGRSWTLEDILLVPEVTDIALSRDKRFAIYSVEAADPSAGKPRLTLRLLDLAARAQRTLRTADMVKSLRPIPGTDDWSGLMDLGEGLQLYRIASSGAVEPLLVNADTVPVGRADMSLAVGGGTVPHRIGVLAYDWAPDGRWLWYALLKPVPNPRRIRFDDEVRPLQARRRSSIEAEIEYYLRRPDGESVKVMTRPSSDRMALHAAGNILWRGDEIQFRIETPGSSAGGTYEVRAWNRVTGAMRTLADEHDLQTLWILRGPRGGTLGTTGTGDRLELAESFADGRKHNYGRFGFTIGDLRSAGISVNAELQRAVLGTRSLGNPRYGLAVVDKRGVREIRNDASLTRCGFDAALTVGVCVAEGMSRPPSLVQVDIAKGSVTPLVSVSPRHDEIAPLVARPHIWRNRDGYRMAGYVVLPRGYRAGTRYPAIVVTHGGDADDRFSEIGNQWNYPVQLFAERGYVVLLLNDPWPQQSDELMAAYNAWIRGSGPPGPDTLQRLIWINGVRSFEDAVLDLAREGLVDPDRVGIAGYSRGSQLVNVAVTQSNVFRAASSGDGGFLEPAGYLYSAASYDPVYGGGPLSEHIEAYRKFAPSLNAARICTPVLQQVASASPPQIEFYDALRAVKVPTQISYYPGASAASDETHIFHIPSNRLLAMRENIAWFDFWLRGIRDDDAPFPGRLAQWEQMATRAQPCPSPVRP
ncbi:prolyl oligopeptidase family serine peptidase [Sphingopyxis sp.]|uniref:prolyl oligopeptidase family serine peptidase n=1 Tax=Sphingopyxis sp. TaxID=1908224 RepID=UPI002D7954E0|nr:prolyl oligopeptidase family serine peptidase [Sphingopyxis sp.]HET6523209.1 prolyl oligopeptidase family serine peptidase [Sphingopyxis sp.]